MNIFSPLIPLENFLYESNGTDLEVALYKDVFMSILGSILNYLLMRISRKKSISNTLMYQWFYHRSDSIEVELFLQFNSIVQRSETFDLS